MKSLLYILLLNMVFLSGFSQRNSTVKAAEAALLKQQFLKGFELLELYLSKANNRNANLQVVKKMANTSWQLKNYSAALYWYLQLPIDTLKNDPTISLRMTDLYLRKGNIDSALFWIRGVSQYRDRAKLIESYTTMINDSSSKEYTVSSLALSNTVVNDMHPILLKDSILFWLNDRMRFRFYNKLNVFEQRPFMYPSFVYNSYGLKKSGEPLLDSIFRYQPRKVARSFTNLYDNPILFLPSIRNNDQSAEEIGQTLNNLFKIDEVDKRFGKGYFSYCSRINDSALLCVFTNIQNRSGAFKHHLFTIYPDSALNKWRIGKILSFTNNTSPQLYAAIDPDEQYLVISYEDRIIHNYQIYYQKKIDSTTWGVPVSLTEVNTERDEIYPNFDQEGNLFFSSNGLAGIGGFDIYQLPAGNWMHTKPTLVSYPINSVYNDYGWAWRKKDSTVFFTSDRYGSNNILLAKWKPILQKTFPDIAYPITTDTLVMPRIPTRDTVFYEVVKRKNIYFDFDKSVIRKDARIVADIIINEMHKDSSLVIAFAAFTDCIGTNIYNIKLSKRRMNSLRTYLVSKGIAVERILSDYYGEQYQRDACSPKPSARSNQMNRRCEMILSKKVGKKWIDYEQAR